MSTRVDVKYGRPRFRPTVWPETVIKIPSLTPVLGVEIVGDWILWPKQDQGGVRQIELKADFYLRELMDLELDDLDAIAALVTEFGYFCSFGLEELEPAVRHERLIPVDAPTHDAFYTGHHRENIAAHLESAQNAVEIWVASQIEGGLEELVDEYVTEDALAYIGADAPELETLEDVREIYIRDRLDQLEGTLNAALGKFSVGIGDLNSRVPTVYSVSFLQLYNHIVEHASIKHCANDHCENVFVRQRGRAAYGQHKSSGVKYCSRNCARAQAQRNLRRRQRA